MSENKVPQNLLVNNCFSMVEFEWVPPFLPSNFARYHILWVTAFGGYHIFRLYGQCGLSHSERKTSSQGGPIHAMGNIVKK